MTDIVERLRETLTGHATNDEMMERVVREREEAADEIARLRAQNKRLHAALRQAHLNTRGQIAAANELVRAITLASGDIDAALKGNGNE